MTEASIDKVPKELHIHGYDNSNFVRCGFGGGAAMASEEVCATASVK